MAVSERLRVAALDCEGTGESLLADLTGEPVGIRLDGWGASARAAILDADGAQRGWRSPGTRLRAAPQRRLPPNVIGRLTPV